MTFLDVKARGGVVLSLASLYRSSAPMGQNLMSLEAYKCQGPYGANFSAKVWLLMTGQRTVHKIALTSLSFVLSFSLSLAPPLSLRPPVAAQRGTRGGAGTSCVERT